MVQAGLKHNTASVLHLRVSVTVSALTPICVFPFDQNRFAVSFETPAVLQELPDFAQSLLDSTVLLSLFQNLR